MKKLKSLLAACILINGVSAQTDDYVNNLIKVLPLSPNAASLGKYGDLSVGYYTGIPDVNVPIYTIKVGDIKVPLTLSYHTGGVKVEDIASWVGMGWSFSFAGSITRQMRGIADEDGGGYLTTNGSITQFSSWTTEQKEGYISSTKQGLADPQNDIFSYSVGGQSGKFFFKPNGEIIAKPRNRMKFLYGTFYGKSGWKATNTDGIVYYFLDKEETTSFASSLPSSGDPTTAFNTWYISKIFSAEGKDSIMFEYETESVTYTSNLLETVYLQESAISYCSENSTLSNFTANTLALKLKRIKFKNGEVIINAMTTEREDLTGSHALQSIQVKNILNREIKRFDFFYTTVSAPPNQQINKRLFLDSIRVSVNALSLGTYKFEYESRHLLPDRQSNNQDHWGYFNGANNSTLIPYCYYSLTEDNKKAYLGADRTPNHQYSKVGTLKKLYYPTGGHTELLMENNTASNLLSVIEPGFDLKDTTIRFQIFGDGAGNQTIYTGNFSITQGYGQSGGVRAKIQIGLPGSSSTPPPPASPDDPIIQLTKPNGSNLYLRNNVNIFLEKGNYSIYIDFSSNPDSNLIRNFYLIIDYDYGVRDNPTKLKNCIVGGLRVKSIKDVDPVTGMVYERSFSYLQDDGITSTGTLGSFPSYKGYIETCINIDSIPYTCHYLTLGSLSQSTALQTKGSYVGYSMVDELVDRGNNGKNRFFYTTSENFDDLGSYKTFPYPPGDLRDEFRGILLKEQVFSKAGNTNNYAIVSEKTYNYDFGIAYSAFDSLRVMLPGLSFRQILSNQSCLLTSSTVFHTVSDFFTTSGFISLLSDTNRIFDLDNPNKFSQVINTYEYSGRNLQVNKVTTNKSTGDLSVITHKFPLDYSFSIPATDNKIKGLNSLIDKNKINSLVETSESVSIDGGPLNVVQSTFISYNPDVARPDTVFRLDRNGPVIDFAASTVQSDVLSIDNRYSPRFIFNKYLQNGNLLQQQKVNNVQKSYIWDGDSAYAVAEVINADVNQIAYTSFETNTYGGWSLNAGSSVLINNGNVTGNKSLNGGVSKTVPQGNYILSLWASGTPTLNGQPFPVAARKNPVPGKYYYEIELDNISSVDISGSNIDEVRLYPKGSEMISLTYEPLVGITSQSDARGYINYYDYDAAGRLSVIRNEEGHVVKTIDYHYKNQ